MSAEGAGEAALSDEATYCGAELGETRSDECECLRCLARRALPTAGRVVEVERVLARHVRLTRLDRPYSCQCDPHTSDASQSFSDHLLRVLAEDIRNGD